MKFQSVHAMHAVRNTDMKRLAVRSMWGLLASVGIIGALVMAIPL